MYFVVNLQICDFKLHYFMPTHNFSNFFPIKINSRTCTRHPFVVYYKAVVSIKEVKI